MCHWSLVCCVVSQVEQSRFYFVGSFFPFYFSLDELRDGALVCDCVVFGVLNRIIENCGAQMLDIVPRDITYEILKHACELDVYAVMACNKYLYGVAHEHVHSDTRIGKKININKNSKDVPAFILARVSVGFVNGKVPLFWHVPVFPNMRSLSFLPRFSFMSEESSLMWAHFPVLHELDLSDVSVWRRDIEHIPSTVVVLKLNHNHVYHSDLHSIPRSVQHLELQHA